MNCQDISRIVDSRQLNGLTTEERHGIEAHALSCGRCAVGWVMHARLAELQIPPMPAELPVRCRAIAAAPVRAIATRRVSRRIVIACSVAALAAAAGVLTVRMKDRSAPQINTASTAPRPAETFAAPAAEGPPVIARDGAMAGPAASIAVATAPLNDTLPLLPAPVYADNKHQLDLVLQHAIARYPEMVQGPQIEGRFVLVLIMRENGEVLSSAMRLTTPQNDRDVTAELDRMLPSDAGNQTFTVWMKTNPLPDGRLLRTNASVHYSVVPNDYDESRSSVRVQEILGQKYAELMLPGDNEVSRLTVFLTGDGHIDRESTERVRLQDMKTVRSDDPEHVVRFAESIASKLSLDIGQIGLMGVTAVEEGSAALVRGADGDLRLDDKRRRLFVYYAWQRRPKETAPKWGQNGADARKPTLDLAAALTIAERQLPEAFTASDRSAGDPTVVLTAAGEIIRAGWVKTKPGEPIARTLQEQLVPGVQTSSFMSQRLTNAAGSSADIFFAWEQPDPGKEAPKN